MCDGIGRPRREAELFYRRAAAEPDGSVPAENEVLGLGGDGGDGGDAGSIIAVTGAETTALATIGVTLVAVGAMGVIHARRSRSE